MKNGARRLGTGSCDPTARAQRPISPGRSSTSTSPTASSNPGLASRACAHKAGSSPSSRSPRGRGGWAGRRRPAPSTRPSPRSRRPSFAWRRSRNGWARCVLSRSSGPPEQAPSCFPIVPRSARRSHRPCAMPSPEPGAEVAALLAPFRIAVSAPRRAGRIYDALRPTKSTRRASRTQGAAAHAPRLAYARSADHTNDSRRGRIRAPRGCSTPSFVSSRPALEGSRMRYRRLAAHAGHPRVRSLDLFPARLSGRMRRPTSAVLQSVASISRVRPGDQWSAGTDLPHYQRPLSSDEGALIGAKVGPASCSRTRFTVAASIAPRPLLLSGSITDDPAQAASWKSRVISPNRQTMPSRISR